MIEPDIRRPTHPHGGLIVGLALLEDMVAAAERLRGHRPRPEAVRAAGTPDTQRSVSLLPACSSAHHCGRRPGTYRQQAGHRKRRDAVYGDHKDLVEELQAQVKAPALHTGCGLEVAEQNVVLKRELKDAKAALAAEKERNSALVRVAAELSLELEQARAELESAQNVPPLRGTRSPRLPPRRRR